MQKSETDIIGEKMETTHPTSVQFKTKYRKQVSQSFSPNKKTKNTPHYENQNHYPIKKKPAFYDTRNSNMLLENIYDTLLNSVNESDIISEYSDLDEQSDNFNSKLEENINFLSDINFANLEKNDIKRLNELLQDHLFSAALIDGIFEIEKNEKYSNALDHLLFFMDSEFNHFGNTYCQSDKSRKAVDRQHHQVNVTMKLLFNKIDTIVETENTVEKKLAITTLKKLTTTGCQTELPIDSWFSAIQRLTELSPENPLSGDSCKKIQRQDQNNPLYQQILNLLAEPYKKPNFSKIHNRIQTLIKEYKKLLFNQVNHLKELEEIWDEQKFLVKNSENSPKKIDTTTLEKNAIIGHYDLWEVKDTPAFLSELVILKERYRKKTDKNPVKKIDKKTSILKSKKGHFSRNSQTIDDTRSTILKNIEELEKDIDEVSRSILNLKRMILNGHTQESLHPLLNTEAVEKVILNLRDMYLEIYNVVENKTGNELEEMLNEHLNEEGNSPIQPNKELIQKNKEPLRELISLSKKAGISNLTFESINEGYFQTIYIEDYIPHNIEKNDAFEERKEKIETLSLLIKKEREAQENSEKI